MIGTGAQRAYRAKVTKHHEWLQAKNYWFVPVVAATTGALSLSRFSLSLSLSLSLLSLSLSLSLDVVTLSSSAADLRSLPLLRCLS